MSSRVRKPQQRDLADGIVLEKLVDIGQSLIAVRNLPPLLQKIAETAGTILSADVVVLYEYEAETHDVKIPPTIWGKLQHPGVLKGRGRQRPHKDSIVFKVLRRAEPIYASNGREDLVKAMKDARWDPAKSFVQREGIASTAAIRLFAQNKAVGALFINYRSHHPFSSEEKRIIQLFAAQAATAIQNARLFRLEREQRQRAETLRRVAQIVNSNVSLGELVESILEQLRSVIEYDSASVQVVQGDRRVLAGGRGFDPDKSSRRLLRNISEDPLMREIIQQRVPTVLSDVAIDERWEITPATAHVKSWIGAPLIAKDQVIGLLTLDHRKKGFYTTGAGELIAAFADQVATAVYNGIQKEALTELNKLTHRFISSEEPRLTARTLLEDVARSAEQVLKADVIDLYEYRQAAKHFDLPPVSFGHKRVEDVPKTEIREDDVIHWLIREKRPLFIEDVQSHAAFTQPFAADRPRDWPSDRFVVREGIRSSAFMPLTTGSEVVGYMYVSYRTPQRFPAEQRELISLFAGQAAAAIQNTRLYLEAKSRVGLLNALHETSLGIVQQTQPKMLLHTLTERTAKLIAGDRYRGIGAAYWRCDHSTRTATIEYSPNDRLMGRTLRFDEGLLGEVIRTGKAQFINNYPQWPGRAGAFAEEGVAELVKNVLEVPIKEGGRIAGILAVTDATGERPFGDSDVEFLERLANLVGIAIENVRLLERLSVQLESLHRAVRESSLEDIIDHTLTDVRPILGDDISISINLLESGGLRQYRAAGPLKDYLLSVPPRPGGVGAYVAETGEPLFLDDVSSPSNPITIRKESIERGVKSFAALPFKRHGKIDGVIFINVPRSITFTEDMQRDLQLFAVRVAASLDPSPEERALHSIVYSLRDLFDGAPCAIRLYDSTTGEFGRRVTADPQPEQWDQPPRPDGTSWQVINTKTALYIDESTVPADRFLAIRPEFQDMGVQAIAHLPIISSGDVIGLLYLDLKKPYRFSDNDKRVLELFASQASVAIENARLYERQVKAVAALESVNDAVVTKDHVEILHLIVHNVLDVIPGEYSELWLWDPAKKDLLLEAAYGPAEDAARQLGRFAAGTRSINLQVARSGQPYICKDTSKEDNFYRIYEAAQSSLTVPLEYRGEVIGTLNVESARPAAFSEHHIPLLSVFANTAAIAIENARLFGQTKRQNAELNALYEVGKEITASLDWEQTLQLIAEKVRDLTECARSLVVVVREGTEEVTAKGCGYEVDYLAGFTYQELRDGVSGWVLDHDEPALIPDVLADERCKGIARTAATQFNSKSLAIAPLRVRNKVIGTLTAVNAREGLLFTQKTLDTVEGFADQAAIAIENARLYRSLQAVSELTQQLTSSYRWDEQGILDLLHKKASSLMDTSNMYIALYDETTDTVRFPLMFIDGKPAQVESRRSGKGRTEWIIRNRKPVFIETHAESVAWYDEYGKEYIGEPFASWVGVPMLAGNKVLGVIATYHKAKDYVYSRGDQKVLESMASQAAAVLQNARLWEAMQKLSEDLSAVDMLDVE
jgi:GAF domain-containing protein